MLFEITAQVLLWSSLLTTPVLSQAVKQCYRFDGTVAVNPANAAQPDVPCSADAEVSACCSVGTRCGTNLFCVTDAGDAVGTCTDKTWTDPRCPLLLNSTLNTLDSTRFDYAQNTTRCADATICPGPDNTLCCDAKQGVAEILYQNSAVIPADQALLPSYYSQAITAEVAAKTLPTSTPVTPDAKDASDTAAAVAPEATFERTSAATPVPPPSQGRMRASPLAIFALVFSVFLITVLIAALFWIRAVRRRRQAREAAKVSDDGVVLDDEKRSVKM